MIKVKYIRSAVFLMLFFLLLEGCKKKDISYNVDKADNDSIMKSSLTVPDSCTYEFNTSGTDINKICLDTKNIVVPNVDNMPTVYYEKIKLSSEYRKHIAENLFDISDGIYVYDGKSMSSQMLAELEEYYSVCVEKARKKNDGTAEPIYEDMLASIKNQYASAKELEPTEDYEGYYYIGFINGKRYLLDFSIVGGGFELKRYPEEFTVDMISAEDKTQAACFTKYGDGMEQDLINTNDLNVSTMSKEDAVTQSMNFLSDLGIMDITSVEAAAAEWRCYDLLWGEEGSSTIYDGYYVTFTNDVNSVIPYLGYYDWVNSLKVKGEYKEGLTVQTYEVCINDNGIIKAVCHDKYCKAEKAEENQQLMSWNEMLEVVDLYIDEYYTSKKISGDIIFNHVELTYFMTKINDDEYALKPVWVFSSLEDVMISYNVDMYPTELLIVDAITGIPIEIVD